MPGCGLLPAEVDSRAAAGGAAASPIPGMVSRVWDTEIQIPVTAKTTGRRLAADTVTAVRDTDLQPADTATAARVTDLQAADLEMALHRQPRIWGRWSGRQPPGSLRRLDKQLPESHKP